MAFSASLTIKATLLFCVVSAKLPFSANAITVANLSSPATRANPSFSDNFN